MLWQPLKDAITKQAERIEGGQGLPHGSDVVISAQRLGNQLYDLVFVTGPFRQYPDIGLASPLGLCLTPHNPRDDANPQFWYDTITNNEVVQAIRRYSIMSFAEHDSLELIPVQYAVGLARQAPGAKTEELTGEQGPSPEGPPSEGPPAVKGAPAPAAAAQVPGWTPAHEDAVKALVSLRIPKSQATELVKAAKGTTAQQLAQDALRQHGFARQRVESIFESIFEQGARRGGVRSRRPAARPGAARPGAARPPVGGGFARQQRIPQTPKTLRNGVWYHLDTGTEFFIDDSHYPEAGEQDPPVLALSNKLATVLVISPRTDMWVEDNPPPAQPKYEEMYLAYVRAIRSYARKLAVQMIEQDGWILFWHGYLFTSGRGVNFRAVYERSRYLKRLEGEGEDQLKGDTVITEVDAGTGHPANSFRWDDLKISRNTMRGGGFGMGGGPFGHLLNAFEYVRNDISGDEEIGDLFPPAGRGEQEFGRGGPQGWGRGGEIGAGRGGYYHSPKYGGLFGFGPEYRLESKEDTALDGDLLTALVEAIGLDESLTYNQMLTATANYWQTRLKTVRNVHTTPPGLVMLKDGTVDLQFNFISRPSTEGRPHRGYIKFIPEKGQPKMIDKLKQFLGRIGAQIQKFIGKKVPPQALKGSDLRKMLVECSCDCKDFKYRMSYANVQAGVTSQAGRTDNGRAPIITNPARRPGFCKHCLATLRYLTDDAEIEISKELSREQQEALAKDRARFMQEAQAAYEAMKAPEVPPEEIPPVPEEEKEKAEKPGPPAAAKPPLPPSAPPPPALAPPPALPPVAGPPATPNYPSSQ